MLKRDPWIERLRSSTTFTIIALSLTIVAGLFIGLAILLSHKLTLASSGWFVIVIIDTPLLFLLLMRRRLWKRREALRQRALAGDRNLLAVEQPAAHVQAASLPLVIEARQNRSVMGVVIGLVALTVLLLMLGAVLIIFLVMGQPMPSPAHPSVPTIYISGSTLLIAAFAILIVFVLLIGGLVLFGSAVRHVSRSQRMA